MKTRARHLRGETLDAFYALTVSRPSEERLSRVLLDEVDWRAVCALGIQVGTAPLVYWNARKYGLDAMFPSDAIERLRHVYVKTLQRGMRLRDRFLTLHRRCAEAGVDILPLKGIALALDAYEDAGLRPTADIDIFVAERDVPRALRTCIELGYRLTSPTIRGVIVSGQGKTCQLAKSDEPAIDMHYRLFPWYEERYVYGVDSQEFFHGARASRFPSYAGRMLRSEDAFLYAVLSICSCVDAQFRYYVDADAILRAQGDTFDWQRVRAIDRLMGNGGRGRQILSELASAFGTPLPADLRPAHSAFARRVLSERIIHAEGWWPAPLQKVASETRLLLLANGASNRLALMNLFLRWNVFKWSGALREFFLARNNPVHATLEGRESTLR